MSTSPAPLPCQLALDRSTDAPLVGGQGSGQEGCQGVLLDLSARKYQWDGPEEGGVGMLLSLRDGLIRLSAKRTWLLCIDLVLHTHTHRQLGSVSI